MPVFASVIGGSAVGMGIGGSIRLRVFPADVATVPTVSNLNFSAGQKPVPNKVDVKLSSDGKIKLFNAAGSVSVVGDVVGYYTTSSLTELTAEIKALKDAQPFAATKYEEDQVQLTDTPIGTVFVSVTAPVAGQVTLNSTVNVEMGTPGGDLICAIVPSSTIPANLAVESMQVFENGDSSNEGSLSGTRTFDIAVGATVEYTLACEDYGDDGSAHKRNLTAIFTPAP